MYPTYRIIFNGSGIIEHKYEFSIKKLMNFDQEIVNSDKNISLTINNWFVLNHITTKTNSDNFESYVILNTRNLSYVVYSFYHYNFETEEELQLAIIDKYPSEYRYMSKLFFSPDESYIAIYNDYISIYTDFPVGVIIDLKTLNTTVVPRMQIQKGGYYYQILGIDKTKNEFTYFHTNTGEIRGGNIVKTKLTNITEIISNNSFSELNYGALIPAGKWLIHAYYIQNKNIAFPIESIIIGLFSLLLVYKRKQGIKKGIKKQ
jgi:hypothetical protein